MFTGLIETIGSVTGVKQKGDVTELAIQAPAIASELHLGDSVSISGACSTVTWFDANSFRVELMPETLKRTRLGELRTGSPVNLERALRLDSRLDGHIVSGHIDGMATLKRIENEGNTRKLYFSAAPELLEEIVEKGSVTIDGVSLTVIDAEKEFFSVGVIPTTLADTTIGALQEGQSVNLEADILGKYIKKYLNSYFDKNNGGQKMKNSLTWDKLTEYGWN